MLKDKLTRLSIDLIERGYVPDRLTRLGMRKLCERRLAELRGRADPQQFLQESRRAPIAPLPEKANEQHYEVPAEVYELMLGKRRKYSSCFWPEGVTLLDDAEEAALRATCERAGVTDGMDVLELGCGWGSCSLWLAEHFPNCRITAVSNSSSQREYIQRAASRLGVQDRLHVITADMNEFSTDEQFDRVVSVEMFEHMRNHEELLRRIAGWLRPDGKLFVHIFCHRELAYEFCDRDSADWMSRYFFTGGIMPSEDLLGSYDRDMRIVDSWRWSGVHYQKTADAWVENIDAHRRELVDLMGDIYGPRQADVWLQRWRMLFMAGSELFGYREGQEWYVSHYLFDVQPQKNHQADNAALVAGR